MEDQIELIKRGLVKASKKNYDFLQIASERESSLCCQYRLTMIAGRLKCSLFLYGHDAKVVDATSGCCVHDGNDEFLSGITFCL